MRKSSRFGAWIAAGLLVLTGASAWAQPGNDKDKKERRRIVVVNENGKERVIEGEGLMVRRGYLGVGLTELTSELRTHFGAPEDAGVMVSRVEPGSPAEKAGVKVGDILTSVDGKEVKSSWDILAQMRGQEDGAQVPLEVWRDGRAQTLSAAVELRERSELDMAPMLLRDGDGDLLFRFDRERGGPLVQRIERPESGPGPGRPRVQVHRLNTPREAELEAKLKALEKRIADLEKQLERQQR